MEKEKQFSQGMAWIISLFFVAISVLFWQGGCSCGNNGIIDAGVKEVIPEVKPNFTTRIRFITPLSGEIISGQISIEVEVLDDDGIEKVSFWANDKAIGTKYATTSTSTLASPRYAIDIATSFLPRGILSLTVRTEDKRRAKASKTIQIKTRERWIAAFGVGQVKQLIFRSDQHLYLRVYRSEEDLARVPRLGPNDKIGSSIMTANAIGSSSWIFKGIGQEFSPFALDKLGNMYLGSRISDKGVSKLIAVGSGDPKWSPEVPVAAKWSQDLKEWWVQGAPLPWQKTVWVHLIHPGQASTPAYSAIARFTADIGKEEKRYTGKPNEKIDIVRGPYLIPVAKSSVIFLSRKAGEIVGFDVRLLGSDGTLAWQKKYEGLRISVVHWDKAYRKLFIGVERRDKNGVIASSLICIDPVQRKEIWRSEFEKKWPSKLSSGANNIYVVRNIPGGSKELVAIQRKDGVILWKKDFTSHDIRGILAQPNDTCFIFNILLDSIGDPDRMEIERYNAKGEVTWRYTHQQFFPKYWHFSKEAGNILWLILRNINDPQEQLGNKLLSLDNKGKRRFIFYEEKRHFQFMYFLPKNSLFISSSDIRDARVHHLIP